MIAIMLRRIVLTFILAMLPLGALADASALQVTGGSSTSTDNAGNQLQTVSPNSLQGSSTNQSDGLVAPSNSNLQQTPANSSAVASYLNGELVGGQQGGRSEPVKADSSLWGNLLATAILVVILGAVLTLWPRRKPPVPAAVATAEVTPEPVAEPTPAKPKPKAKTKRKSKKTRKH